MRDATSTWALSARCGSGPRDFSEAWDPTHYRRPSKSCDPVTSKTRHARFHWTHRPIRTRYGARPCRHALSEVVFIHASRAGIRGATANGTSNATSPKQDTSVAAWARCSRVPDAATSRATPTSSTHHFHLRVQQRNRHLRWRQVVRQNISPNGSFLKDF